MIRKEGNTFQVQSESGKPMGTYRSRAEADLRLRQIEFFKHKNEKAATKK